MSPKNIPQMKFESSVFKITPKNELPQRGGRGGVFKRLSFYPEILAVFSQIQKEGVTPFEDAVTIDLDKASGKDRQFLKQKDPTLSFYIHLRTLAKQMDITKHVEIRRIGDRIHLVGL